MDYEHCAVIVTPHSQYCIFSLLSFYNIHYLFSSIYIPCDPTVFVISKSEMSGRGRSQFSCRENILTMLKILMVLKIDFKNIFPFSIQGEICARYGLDFTLTVKKTTISETVRKPQRGKERERWSFTRQCDLSSST